MMISKAIDKLRNKDQIILVILTNINLFSYVKSTPNGIKKLERLANLNAKKLAKNGAILTTSAKTKKSKAIKEA